MRRFEAFPKRILLSLLGLYFGMQPLILGQTLRFTHGVASGDPWPHQVIIWTRAVPDTGIIETGGLYQIAKDSAFNQLLIENVFRTDTSRDFTVKIDVEGLDPGQTYYYRFGHRDHWSPVGRTRTAITRDQELQFAVVSCNNYQHGYFGAYRVIAGMDSLQAVIHLGDYIYESMYGAKKSLPERKHKPNREIISLADYRERYAQYRSDPDLQAAHQQHPFIVVWDDHESSNNSSKDGAQGHQPDKDGEWADRLAAARQAYYEWMPIREGGPLYRQFQFGPMADLFMLDTRIAGRETQIYDVADSALYAPDRSLLGAAQREWLLGAMAQSKARWKLLGNQVLFSPMYGDHISRRLENAMLDIWDGYPAERRRLTHAWKEEALENVVVLTGDFHVGIAFEIPPGDWNFPLDTADAQVYNTEAAVGVEYAVPSVSSDNFDEFARRLLKLGLAGRSGAKYLEQRLQKDFKSNKEWPGNRQPINPHIRYMNLRDHGFLTLNVSSEEAIITYYLQKHTRKERDIPTPRKRFKTPLGTTKVIPIDLKVR